jgi:hypothetical protein
MAGLLDSKERIFDFVLTNHGRRLLSQKGKFVPTYASFSDMYAVYDFASSGTLYFEAPTNAPIDTISFETGNAGGVFLETVPGYVVKDGQLMQWFPASDGPPGATYLQKNHLETMKSGSQMLLTASLDNLKRNSILTSVFPEFDMDNFVIEPTDISFTITEDYPFDLSLNKSNATTTIEAAADIEEDKVFSSVINFQHLPPVTKPGIGPGSNKNLGEYSRLSPIPWTTNQMHTKIVKLNASKNWKVTFPETSHENNNVLQFFEFSQTDGVKKLTIVEGPTMYAPPSSKAETVDGISETDVQPSGNYAKMLFVGKLFIDRKNAPTFINMFTIVLSNAKEWAYIDQLANDIKLHNQLT